MSQNIHELVYSTVVLDFVKSAKEFTDLLADEFPQDRKEFVLKALLILPVMYSGMLAIPATQPVFDGENEKHVTEAEWSEIYQKVYTLLGSQNEYLDLPEEDEYDRLEVISRELSEDMADIYQDIRDFLEVFRVSTEEIMNDVLWECKLNFENYWGKKVLRLSLNLHKILTRDPQALERMDSAYDDKHGGREIDTDDWFISRRQQDRGGESELSD